MVLYVCEIVKDGGERSREGEPLDSQIAFFFFIQILM